METLESVALQFKQVTQEQAEAQQAVFAAREVLQAAEQRLIKLTDSKNDLQALLLHTAQV